MNWFVINIAVCHVYGDLPIKHIIKHGDFPWVC